MFDNLEESALFAELAIDEEDLPPMERHLWNMRELLLDLKDILQTAIPEVKSSRGLKLSEWTLRERSLEEGFTGTRSKTYFVSRLGHFVLWMNEDMDTPCAFLTQLFKRAGEQLDARLGGEGVDRANKSSHSQRPGLDEPTRASKPKARGE